MKSIRRVFCVLLIASVWHLTLGKDVQISTVPYCNKVLGGKGKFELDIKIQGFRFYSVSCKPNGVYAAESCDIDSSHGLRIEFDRMTRISEILLEESTFVGKFTKVRLLAGKASYECKYSLEHPPVIVYNKNFTKFPCGSINGAKNSEGFMGSAIHINSTVHRKVNLTTLRTDGILDWIVVTEEYHDTRTENRPTKELERDFQSVPADNGDDETFGNHWNGMSQEDDVHSEGSQKHEERLLNECPPIDPYFGMPKNYIDHQLVLDGSINDRILEKPCQEGFIFVGKPSDITLCRNGTWQGSGFPKCKEIRIKTPREVDHATWSYVREEAFNEVIYTCDDGYYLIGLNKTTFSIESDDWIDVPVCQQDALHWIQDYYWVIIIIAAIAIAVLGAVTAIFVWRKKNCYYGQLKPNHVRKPLHIRRISVDDDGYERTLDNIYEERD